MANSHHNNTFSSVFWNARGLGNKQIELEDFLHCNNIDVCGISEAKFRQTPQQIYKHYNMLYDPHHVTTDGLIILLKRNIPYQHIPLRNYRNIKILGYNIKINNETFSFILMYSLPNTIVHTHTLQQLLNSLYSTNNSTNNIIMGGDLNAHHQAWGSLISTPKGQNIVQFIENNDLACLNSGKFTRLGQPNQRNSAIDITIVSANLIINSHWDTYEDSLGSDHLPIISKFKKNSNHLNNSNFSTPGKRLFKKANWQAFTTELQQRLSHWNEHEPINPSTPLMYSNFIQHLDQVADSFIPSTSTDKRLQLNHPYNKWWTIECDKAKSNRKEATKKLSRLINALTKEEYDRILSETRNTLRQAKKNGWVKNCNSFNRLTPISEIWQQVKAYQYSAARLQSEKPDKIKPEAFNMHLCPDYVPTKDEIPSQAPTLLQGLTTSASA
ncbi:hypothetical protein B566_EDAN012989 [Ephemera danica]|nr:hypothetical protein B566_EDAN012989 [Ephemera danica]